jgi:hypothetical protein
VPSLEQTNCRGVPISAAREVRRPAASRSAAAPTITRSYRNVSRPARGAPSPADGQRAGQRNRGRAEDRGGPWFCGNAVRRSPGLARSQPISAPGRSAALPSQQVGDWSGGKNGDCRARRPRVSGPAVPIIPALQSAKYPGRPLGRMRVARAFHQPCGLVAMHRRAGPTSLGFQAEGAASPSGTSSYNGLPGRRFAKATHWPSVLRRNNPG